MNGRLRTNESEVAVLKAEVAGVKAKSVGAGGLSGGVIAFLFEALKGIFWK